jgi:DNA-directed RNA polymerase specialized sigma24 family protein
MKATSVRCLHQTVDMSDKLQFVEHSLVADYDKLKFVGHIMSPAKKLQELRQEDFDRLLNWLDSDVARAGQIYEQVRWRLVAILASRGCHTPEELADETIDRVARRVADIQETYVGDKAIYFLGVMNNVHHEYLRRPQPPRLVERDENVEAKEEVHACLDNCLTKLAPHARQLIERYYDGSKRVKIDARKLLARELGINATTLRLRALRIREKLQTCIDQCLEVSEARP